MQRDLQRDSESVERNYLEILELTFEPLSEDFEELEYEFYSELSDLESDSENQFSSDESEFETENQFLTETDSEIATRPTNAFTFFSPLQPDHYYNNLDSLDENALEWFTQMLLQSSPELHQSVLAENPSEYSERVSQAATLQAYRILMERGEVENPWRIIIGEDNEDNEI